MSTELHELTWLKNNFKQYVAGQIYNGVLLDVTINQTGAVLSRAVFNPYRMIGGEYRLKCQMDWTHLNLTTQYTIQFAGVTFYSGISQVVSSLMLSAGSSQVQINPASDNLTVYPSATTTGGQIWFDAELASWPTWADDII